MNASERPPLSEAARLAPSFGAVRLARELTEVFPAEWQTALSDGDVLFNRATPPPTAVPVALPYATALPRGFTDFDHDQPLDGPLQPGQITEADGQVTLTAAGRVLALAPVGPGEYRFAGWSEQRTLRVAHDGVLLCVRRGRAIQKRHLPDTVTPWPTIPHSR